MSDISYVASYFVDCIDDPEFIGEVAKQLLHNGINVQLDLWIDEKDFQSNSDMIVNMAADSSADMFAYQLDQFKQQIQKKLQELAKQATITELRVNVKFD